MQPTILCIGQFAVEPEGLQPVPRHLAALLSLLACADSPGIERHVIADMLWDGDDAAKKKHSLSQLLYSLRRRNYDFIRAVRSRLLLDTQVESDVRTFKTAAKEQDIETVVEVYRGSFLEGFPYVTDIFDDWRTQTAAWMEFEAVSAYGQLIAKHIAAGHHADAARVAKAALLVRPTDESFARARVEALALNGDMHRAVHELDSYRKRIVSETGTLPASLSDDLAASIARMPINVGASSSATVSTPLVGRSTELGRLDRHLHTLDSISRIAFLYGEPGIGKTRLVLHTLRLAAIRGGRIFAYSCSEAESRLPYSGIVGLIRDGDRSSDHAYLDSRWRHVLGEVLPEVLSSSESRNRISPRRMMWEAAAHYFESISNRAPLLIAVDDIQWLDGESRDVLTYLMKRLSESRVHFVYAGRPNSPLLVYEDSRSTTLTIELGEIHPRAIEELIQYFESQNNVTINESTRRQIVEHVGGRPFYLIQALSHAVRASDASASSDWANPTLFNYVDRRIGELSHSARLVAQALAVSNRAMPIHLLSAAAGLPIGVVSRSLDELVRNGIVADNPTPQFSHDLVRQAVLRGLTEVSRAAWHDQIAHALHAKDPSALSEAAHHFEMARNHVEACRLAVVVADAAAKNGEFGIACEHYAQALRCSVPGKRDVVLRGYLSAAARAGAFEGLYPFLDELERALASQPDDGSTTLFMLARFTQLELQGGRSLEESVQMANTLVAFSRAHLRDELATVVWQVADVIRRSGDAEQLVQVSRVLLEQSRDAPISEKGEMLAAAALLGGLSRGFQFARPLAEDAVRQALAVPDGICLVRALFSRGTTALWAGSLSEARRDYERALSLAEAHAMGPIVSSIKSNLSIVALEQGQFDEAAMLAEASLRESGPPKRAYAYGNLATIHLRLEDWAGVNVYANALLESYATVPHSWIPAHAQALKGLSAQGLGDTESFHGHAAAVRNLGQISDPLVDPSHVHVLLARSEARWGNTAAALERTLAFMNSVAATDAVAAARMRLEYLRVLQCTSSTDITHHLTSLLNEAKRRGWNALAAEVRMEVGRDNPPS